MRVVDDLRVYLERYNAVDASIALCVSDLWLPNISSQIKHTLAFTALASTSPERFNENERINTYPTFRNFMQGVYKLLPSFPMLEDYIPEPDWGEVRVESCGNLFRTFYGAGVERMPDFITAFSIHHGRNTDAIKDMHAALMVQDHILEHVGSAKAGTIDGVESGHIEVPSDAFWSECTQAISSLSGTLDAEAATSKFILELGDVSVPKSMDAFANAVMSGRALPGYLLRIESSLVPISLRNATGLVVQYWADAEDSSSSGQDKIDLALCGFLKQRVPPNGVIEGPCLLGNRDRLLPYEFSVVLTEAEACILVMPVSENNVNILADLNRDLKELLDSEVEWVVFQKGSGGIVQIRNSNGEQPSSSDVIVIAVINRVSTGSGVVHLPDTDARVFFLVDFVSIMDSIEDIEELSRFLEFVDHNSFMINFSGMADQYAAFRDSYSHLVEGAVQPGRMFLDPHWGSNWRYRQLRDFWLNAPATFPDDQWASWKTKKEGQNIFCLTKRQEPVLSWCVEIDQCTVHFIFRMDKQELSREAGSTLETMINCLADALVHRSDIVARHPLFGFERITVECLAQDQYCADNNSIEDDDPLLSGWEVANLNASSTADIRVAVNLTMVEERFSKAKDASFEVEAVVTWMEGASDLLGLTSDPSYRAALMETAARPPRFMIHHVQKNAAIPDLPSPVLPSHEHYKLARKNLAHVFKDIGAEAGSYELEIAKGIIDQARDAYRDGVHAEISRFGKAKLVAFCVEQIDSLIGRYDYETIRIKNSLSHEVSFDRSEESAKVHGSYVKESRNYRYLLECALSLDSEGGEPIYDAGMKNLIARIDWLNVLYTASDVLYNGIDVAGLELDHSYVPEVVYSEAQLRKEKKFSEEVAALRMGLGANDEDKVLSIIHDEEEWNELCEAFYKDVGVRLDRILAGMHVLDHWPAVHQSEDLAWKYTESRKKVVATLCEYTEGLDKAGSEKIIDLLVLESSGIRRLLGKSIDEGDVPIWEHNKRDNRYTLKPLIDVDGDCLLWGAAAVEKSSRIWRSSFANGYMPADFDWPNVKRITGRIMARLAKDLERVALEVTQRFTPYALGGIDFKRRFRSENFPDVGDYDVLAYWPDSNIWSSFECKYNQPVFCHKDARRLRERIYGRGQDRGQFSKIERRRDFLVANTDRLRSLLGWPLPADEPVVIHELYVAKDIHWWLRNPPYDVPTKFLSVDTLENWFRNQNLSSENG